MAWFGESLANIKGQINSFAKEVLAEGPEEEGDGGENGTGETLGYAGNSSEEWASSKKIIADLQSLCSQQKNEIEHFKLLATGFQEKSEALDIQNKSLVESYQKLIELKDDANKKLQEQIEEIQREENGKLQEQIENIKKEEDARLHQRIQEIQKEYEAKAVVANSITRSEVELKKQPEAHPIAVQTEDRDIETCDAETNTEDVSISDNEEADAAAKAEQESYLRELEERCGAYQNDLYVLRGELMTLQSDVDQNEEARAKLNEEIFGVLHSDFLVDGKSALPKLRYSGIEASNEGEQIFLSALRQLASIWRCLNDKKSTLERTVTKLSAHHNATAPQNEVELPVNEFPNEEPSSPHDYFPQRLDSFGLETIIEEERNDEEFKPGEFNIDGSQRKRTASDEIPTKPEVERCSSATQTDVCVDADPEVIKSTLLASLEFDFNEKERSWSDKVEQREGKIKRLESELERLKSHLVDLEDQHTIEALSSEEKERELRRQIAELQNQITHILQQSERSSEVRDEISRLETERDFARAQSRSYEEQLQKLNIQLQNLNFVLEQFQKEKEAEVVSVRKGLRSEMSQLETLNRSLREELKAEKELLEKARSGLDAARQLNLQIEEKSRIISTLRTQVQEGEAEVTKLKSQLEEVANNNVAKIDRYLVKNLVVGYFSTPRDKRQEVLKIIATVLDFNREDRQKTGLESTSLWPFKSETSSSGDKQSLSEAFIHFLETESQPKAQIRIPMEEMSRQHSRTASESSSASGTVPSTSLAASEMSMNLPVLNQADRSNSILKDVLNPRS